MKWNKVVVFLICLAVLPGVLWAQTKTDDERMAEIRGLLSGKNFSQALNLIEAELERTAAQKQPPYVENGMLYLYAESADSLMLLLFLAAGGGSAEDREKMPWYEELDGRFDWEKAAVVPPYRPFLFYAKGYIAIENKDYQVAAEALEQALALYPHYVPALGEKNHLFMLAGMFEEAKALARAALEDTYPQYEKLKAVFWRNLGYIAIEEGELDQAVEYYGKSLELEPDHKGAQSELEYIKKLRK